MTGLSDSPKASLSKASRFSDAGACVSATLEASMGFAISGWASLLAAVFVSKVSSFTSTLGILVSPVVVSGGSVAIGIASFVERLLESFPAISFDGGESEAEAVTAFPTVSSRLMSVVCESARRVNSSRCFRESS